MDKKTTPAPACTTEGKGKVTTDKQQPNNTTKGVTKIRLTPRQKRFVVRARKGPLPREEADRVCGASNSPEIARQLRAKGYAIDTERHPVTNQDGDTSYIGIYHLKVEPAGVEL